MATVSFNAIARDTSGKGAARSLRARGQVPAVIYGHGREPLSLSLNARDLDRCSVTFRQRAPSLK